MRHTVSNMYLIENNNKVMFTVGAVILSETCEYMAVTLQTYIHLITKLLISHSAVKNRRSTFQRIAITIRQIFFPTSLSIQYDLQICYTCISYEIPVPTQS